MVSPAAIACPPPAISNPLSLAASTAAPRSTPLIDRPDPLPVPSSSSAMTIAGRPKRSFDAPGDDADHAGVPAAAHDRDDRRLGLVARLRLGLFGDQHLDRPPLLVQAVELGGDGARFLGVLGREQAHAKVRLAHPAAGIDPGPEREAEVAARRRLHQPRRFGQGRQPKVAPPRHDPEALRHEGTVERLQASDVGDRAQRDEVEEVEHVRLFAGLEKPAPAKFAHQRDAEQEGHSDRGDMAVGGADFAFVEAVGVDHRHRHREQRGALVMIDDDHVEPGRRGLVERLERLRAAIDRDHQARTALLEADERRARRAIAFHQPVGDVGLRLDAQLAEHEDEQRRAGRAVDVVIAEDGDALLRLDRVRQPARTLVHVLERRRIWQEIADPRVAVPRQVFTTDSSRQQQLVDQSVEAPNIIGAIVGRPPPAPRLAADRSFDVEREAHARIALRSANAVSRGSAGTAWSEKPLPPATPRRTVATPNRRLRALSVTSALWTFAIGRISRRCRHQPVSTNKLARSSA